jgi:gamma-glutamyl hercynylcysteine S-oxide synthase
VAHDSRWDLPLPSPAEVDDYAGRVAQAVAARLRDALTDELAYFAELSLYHELMHIEAWWMAFQALSYAPPPCPAVAGDLPDPPARLRFAAGTVELGSGPDEGFIFDNEKWRHATPVAAFDIDATPVSQGVFLAFVEAGGYQHSAGWSPAGWAWRVACDARHPLYWHKKNGAWQVRRFDQWMPLIPAAPMLHINHYEAVACAAWLGRRLPGAAQWLRATATPAFRWGTGWEWLRDPFAPYPGFSPDPYRDYSQPWFHTHQELRGGGPFTDLSLRRAGFRNFYQPQRRDPFSGFRTVSPE